MENWENRRTKSLTDSLTTSEYITNIETQQEEISKRVQVLTSIPLLQKLQADYDALEVKKQQAVQMRNKKEKQSADINTLIRYSWYFFEHLEELLLGSDNPRTNASLFGLVFEETPTYDEVKFRTAKLACAFVLSEEYKKSKNLSALPEGFEPPTTSLEPKCSIH